RSVCGDERVGVFFFFSSRRRHTRWPRDWSSDVCSSDLRTEQALADALEDHALVLIPANNATQIRRALELTDRWHVNGALYGGQKIGRASCRERVLLKEVEGAIKREEVAGREG